MSQMLTITAVQGKSQFNIIATRNQPRRFSVISDYDLLDVRRETRHSVVSMGELVHGGTRRDC